MSVPLSDSSRGTPRGDNNRTLMIALAVVSAFAVIVPLLLLAFLRTGDGGTETTETVVVNSDEANIAPTPPAASDPPVAVAAAPTAVSSTTPAASNQPAAAPVVTALAGDVPAVFRVTGIASGSALNVRQNAGTTNALIGTLARDATGIAGTGRRVSVDGSEWREIKFNNGTGWVFAGYLAVAPVPAPNATPTPTPTPAEVKFLAAEAPGIYDIVGVSTGASLNVRAEPGATQRLLGTLSGDTAAVPATGERALVGQTEWREIGFRGGLGWVDATFLKLVPEPPKTVLLPTVAASTVGIVPLTSANDRLVLRADPGYDKDVVGTVGASTVNVTATGRLAQIETEVWAEITASGRTGWVTKQSIVPSARLATDVLATNGVAAVAIDKVAVGEDGTVSIQVGGQTTKVAANAPIAGPVASQPTVAAWADTAKSAISPILAEVTVVGNQVTRIWLAP